MKKSLWVLYNKDIVKRCYKNKIAPVSERSDNGKMIWGPLILKTDGGTGCLAKEAKSFEFRQEQARLGQFVLLSCPNCTICTAELDQMYASFQLS